MSDLPKALADVIGSLSELPKGLADVMRSLATKDLREPAHIEALLDISLLVTVILLSSIPSASKSGRSFLMFLMAVCFIGVSLVWLIIHYTVLPYIRRRLQRR